jgi:serine/threonine protein kinase
MNLDASGKENQVNPMNWNIPVKVIGGIDEVVKIEKKIGSGAFGTVYQGTYQKENGETVRVAVKEQTLNESSSQEKRLVKEIEILFRARKCSESVPELYDIVFDTVERKLYLIMDLVQGIDLREYLLGPNPKEPHRNPIRNEEAAMTIILQLMIGLICLHRFKISHRDVKLQNAMINTNTFQAKWIDFGLSCIDICPSSTLGTASTMAPEVILGTVDPEKWRQTDLWSFGCMAYQLVTQKRYPFQSRLSSLYLNLKKSKERDERIRIFKDLNDQIRNEGDVVLSDSFYRLYPKVARILKACLTIDPDIRQRRWKDIVTEFSKDSSDSDERTLLTSERVQELENTKTVSPRKETQKSKNTKVYADTPANRRLKRVGLLKTRATSIPRNTYADNPSNRRKKRVGLPIIRKTVEQTTLKDEAIETEFGPKIISTVGGLPFAGPETQYI